MTDCKVQPKGHTKTRRGQKCWTHTHKGSPTFAFTCTCPCTCVDALRHSEQPFIVKDKTQDVERRNYKTDGVIGDQIGRDRMGRLKSNLNVFPDDHHWHTYRLAWRRAICQRVTLSLAVKGRTVSIIS